jgi:hypothetical protein
VWLVSGVDEAHRFPRWTDAVPFYRQIVGDWLAADRRLVFRREHRH